MILRNGRFSRLGLKRKIVGVANGNERTAPESTIFD